MLERIKHYFDDDRIIFVFSTDLSQLTHTIKKFYGEGYDSCRYLNRFFDLRLKLPEVNLEKYYNCSNINFFNEGTTINIVCKVIIKNYNLSLRQINKFYKLLKISTFNVFNTPEENLFAIRRYVSLVNPLIIVLNIVDINKYNNFINGSDLRPLIELLEYLYNSKYKDKVKERFLNLENDNNMNNDVIYSKLQEQFKKIYGFIFVNDDSKNYQHCVGEVYFNIKLKKLILSSLNLLSDLSYFEEQEENSSN